MKPILPRPLLWTEVRTMDEFINDDIVTFSLYDIVNSLPPELFPKGKDNVKLFNEMYYQMTRIYYEEPKMKDYSKYIKSIVSDMGWNGSADLVLIMIYTYIRIKDLHPKPTILTFCNYIEAVFSYSDYWPYFITFTSNILRFPPSKFDPRVPHPVSPREMAELKLDYETITLDYNLEPIIELVKLWSNLEEKKVVAIMLRNHLNKFKSSYIINQDEIINWLNFVIDEENTRQTIVLKNEIASLKEQLLQMNLSTESNIEVEALEQRKGSKNITINKTIQNNFYGDIDLINIRNN